MLNELGTKAMHWAKYAYLAVFFVLLAGFFHPIITQTSPDSVVVGTLVLFVGLAGTVLIYKAATSSSARAFLFGIGFALTGASLAVILYMTGRI